MSENRYETITSGADRIRWIGIDGGLILGYFIVELLAYIAFHSHVDFLIQWIFPLAVLVIVTYIFVNYIVQLVKFMRHAGKGASIADMAGKKK